MHTSKPLPRILRHNFGGKSNSAFGDSCGLCMSLIVATAMEIDLEVMDTDCSDDRVNYQSLHWSKFRTAVDHCIEKCLKVDMKVFARHYNPVWKNNKEALQNLVERVLGEAKDELKKQLEKAFIDEDIPNLLCLMDEVLEESNKADSNKVAWRPTGDPEADSRAYFMALKRRKLQELEVELQKIKQEERSLQEKVDEKRNKLTATEEEIKMVYRKSQTTVDKLTEFQLNNDSFLTALSMKANKDENFVSDNIQAMDSR